MTPDTGFDFASLLAQNLADFSFFLVLGALAGLAFPLALLSKRALEQSGRVLMASEQNKRRAYYFLLFAACAAMPWTALWMGRWHDGGQIQAAHSVVMIAGSAAAISYLLRRWRLFGG